MDKSQKMINQIWPEELLYWRRMGSGEISEYINKTAIDKRIILIVWGVLEAHGPFLPVANDSHLASLAADYVSYLLYRKNKIQPVIFNSFIDVGSPSATWEFPGAIAYTSSPVPVIREIWEQTLTRMVKEGFKKFFLVNGDGGNWMNHWAQLKWDSKVIRDLISEHNIFFSGANWDQEGGVPYRHADIYDHATIKWATDFSPDFIRKSAIRHGLKPAKEEDLVKIDNIKMEYLENESFRFSNWSKYPGQKKFRGVTNFSLKKYKQLLYDKSGQPLKNSPVERDFKLKIGNLMKKILRMF